MEMSEHSVDKQDDQNQSLSSETLYCIWQSGEEIILWACHVGREGELVPVIEAKTLPKLYYTKI